MNWNVGALTPVRSACLSNSSATFAHLRLHLAAGEHRQAVGVQAVQEVLVRAVGRGVGEQVVVQADLGVHGVLRVHPVDRRALDLAAVGGVAAAGVGVIGRIDRPRCRRRPSCSRCR